jgi:hypothetical protein
LQRHYGFYELESETTENGRHYITPEGIRLPSVTTVLGRKLDKTGLMEWRARVGEEEANKISTQAANRGTAIHLIAEKYLLNQDTYPPKTMPANMDTFKKIQNILDKHVYEINALEAPLYSYKLNTAGRTDCVATWDGVPTIIDFKTSRNIKKEEHIEGYFLQATAYSIMFEELTGVHIPQFAIIIAVDNEEPQVFLKYTKGFYNRVYEVFDFNKSVILEN